ncbi:hypothetical protein HDU93_009104 [Gonapodya sp. JEL0774]|nr:hypothetical protein HDU93_009104 [Gonapodya sp. JEL0774]
MPVRSRERKVVTHVQRLKPYYHMDDSTLASRDITLPVPTIDLDKDDPPLPEGDDPEYLQDPAPISIPDPEDSTPMGFFSPTHQHIILESPRMALSLQTMKD